MDIENQQYLINQGAFKYEQGTIISLRNLKASSALLSLQRASIRAAKICSDGGIAAFFI